MAPVSPGMSERDLAEVCCPLTSRVMSDPVIASDGYTYERKAIEKWIEDGNTTSPRTGYPLASFELLPNEAMAEAVGRAGFGRMSSEGDGKSSGLVVPLVALKDVKRAAARKTDDEISSLSAKASAARQSPRGDADFSSKAIKNLNLAMSDKHHTHSRAKMSPEDLRTHVRETVSGIEEDTNERVLSELTASGRHMITTYLNHTLPCVVVGGATTTIGSSLSSSGAFVGFEVTSETAISRPIHSPGKVLSMSAPAEFPDHFVSVGQEKGVVRVWKYIENEDGDPDSSRGLSAEAEQTAPHNVKKKKKRKSLYDMITGAGRKASFEEQPVLLAPPPSSSLGRWVSSSTIKISADWLNVCSTSKEGNTIFVGDRKGLLTILKNKSEGPVGDDWKTKASLSTNSNSRQINALEIDKDNAAWVCTAVQNEIKIFDVERSGFVTKPATVMDVTHRLSVTALGASRDGNLLMSGGSKGVVAGWDSRMKNTKPIFSYAGPSDEDAIAGIAVNKGLNCAFVADEMGRAFLLDLRTWEVLETLSAADSRMIASNTLTTCGVAMNDHETGTSFSVASSDGVVRTWTKEEDDKEWYFSQCECEGVK
eukprot:CAMPEP_0197568468 /NCGR_PEP_ID=MMETSP1320-20131121/37359_1 /TAXON_ID=91990 /ORGANISM="Bolidomonas sp., Strain RCC2347" /LENGTH=594 /DNA_ID=CAMNT_0043130745 /DNA_START=104 /DNA_END=1885 /DNA_ORIENTATION=-